MIRNAIIVICTTACITLLVSLRWWDEAEAWLADVPQETIKMVRDVAVQYRTENKRQWQCTIDGKKVSLTAIMLAKIANETSYGQKGVGKEINNRGNLHVPTKKSSLPRWDGVSKVWADNAEMVVYPTPQDGLYDLAHWLVKRNCDITRQSTWNYVKWPKAEKTDKRVKAVNAYYKNLKDVAFAYENNKHLYVVDNTETQAQAANIAEKKKHKECHYVATIKQADFIQVDQEEGKFSKSLFLWSKAGNVRLYNCYWAF